MRKRVFVVIGFAAVLLITIFLYLCSKTSWKEEMSTYGPLNIMKLDSEATKNESTDWFHIDSEKDVKITGSISIYEGNAKVLVRHENDILFDKSYGKGNYTFETEAYEDVNGEIEVMIIATDDISGEYSVSMQTRESRLQKVKEKWVN